MVFASVLTAMLERLEREGLSGKGELQTKQTELDGEVTEQLLLDKNEGG